MPKEDKKPDSLTQAYDGWKQTPSPQSLSAVVKAADPIINSAVRSYAENNPALRSRAQLLVAKALPKFDPQKKTKLRNYLLIQLQPLRRIHRDRTQPTKVPERVEYDSANIFQQTNLFRDTHDREPDDVELSDVTGLSEKRINHIRKFSRPAVSESMILESGGDAGNVQTDPEAEITPDEVLLDYFYQGLSPTDRKILAWKLGHKGATTLRNSEIAKKLKISPAAVTQRATRLSQQLVDLMERAT